MLPYPIKFTPLLKSRIWGGNAICKMKNITAQYPKIGESWEISDRKDDNSIVANGSLKGKTFKEIRLQFKAKLLGSNISSIKPFPLLVKILDAENNLSLQVHPAKKVLSQLPDNPQSKNELWYILESKNAEVILGLKRNINPQEFINHLTSADLQSYLNIIPTKAHTIFNVEAGLLHAVGKNNIILEIQENSDTTYRLSDWNRKDSNNQSRALHLQEGLIAVDFALNTVKPIEVACNNNYEVLNNSFCTIFNYYISESIQLFTDSQSCEIISLTDGSVTVTGNNETITLYKGESCFIPANLNYKITLLTKTAGLLITIPKPNLH